MDTESILESVKKKLGILSDYDHFDPEIIDYINSAFFSLNQLAVGPETPFRITDATQTWGDFSDNPGFDAVKTYVALRVRLVFDPPTSSYVLNSISDEIKTLEHRLMIEAEKEPLPDPDMSGIYKNESGWKWN